MFLRKGSPLQFLFTYFCRSMTTSIIIRKGEPADLDQVLALIRELAEYERAPEEVSNTLSQLMEDGFGKYPVYGLLVAATPTEIAGIAIYFTKYSTWKGKGIYLEDIVVGEKFRRRGIGRMLFDAVITESQKAGARQLHWQVLNWNEPAIAFYKKYNASFDDTWINCKLSESQINIFGK